MKRRMICAALAVLALSPPAAAQSYAPGALPPHEILTILRSTGLDPMGQPVRRGPNYVLRAIDDDDREVSVVVNARTGNVLSVTPVQTASRALPNGGVTMGPYEPMPRGWVPGADRPEAYRAPPPGGYRPGAPVVNDDEADGSPTLSRPPRAPSRPSIASRPLPQPGGANQQEDEDVPSDPNVITADPDRTGLLPPPPERFPQRAAPQTQPKPKPVTRAAAAPTKPAPLPKPKPAASAEAITMPATAPLIVPERAQRKAPASEETPH